jgi:hypothetical protein
MIGNPSNVGFDATVSTASGWNAPGHVCGEKPNSHSLPPHGTFAVGHTSHRGMCGRDHVCLGANPSLDVEGAGAERVEQRDRPTTVGPLNERPAQSDGDVSASPVDFVGAEPDSPG